MNYQEMLDRLLEMQRSCLNNDKAVLRLTEFLIN